MRKCWISLVLRNVLLGFELINVISQRNLRKLLITYEMTYEFYSKYWFLAGGWTLNQLELIDLFNQVWKFISNVDTIYIFPIGHSLVLSFFIFFFFFETIKFKEIANVHQMSTQDQFSRFSLQYYIHSVVHLRVNFERVSAGITSKCLLSPY